MNSVPEIRSTIPVTRYLYAWCTDSIKGFEAADGWEKIGETIRSSAVREKESRGQMAGIRTVQLWEYEARFVARSGGWFCDDDFFAFLKQQPGVTRITDTAAFVRGEDGDEWFRFDGTLKTDPYSKTYSDQLFSAFSRGAAPVTDTRVTATYRLRAEQQQAVDQAVAVMGSGVHSETLWNAKPRFGKTLTTYDLVRRMDAQNVLIVTNRPAIANSWFDDYEKFIGWQTSYQFVSDSPSLSQRTPMRRVQWRRYAADHDDARCIQFVSLQDLKGSKYFGGELDKLKYVADMTWDLLVIDEAHEGVDTFKTDVAFDQIKRSHTLHLSGTPFRALAKGRFTQDQIFNWTYADEQKAKADWADDSVDNPYEPLPTLNLFTYQMSQAILGQLAQGIALDEEKGSVDYAFDLGEFFATDENGYFLHVEDVKRWLAALTTNEKYPFSTPELRDEIRHSFWLLNRVASAKALERLLKKDPVFRDYTVILAAGDGRQLTEGALDEDISDAISNGRSLDRVRDAITRAEAVGGRTITLSVGQLTTGVTVPEWTAVLMLSNLASPALYMQAAFRAQNPHTFTRGDELLRKQNAYIFDFAPERTLQIFDQFANNLSPVPALAHEDRVANIRTLLNFFPVIGEDADGTMKLLDPSDVLIFPQMIKAREVVRRGFLSNLLFANIAGIFRLPPEAHAIINDLPTVKDKNGKTGTSKVDVPVPPPVVDADGNVEVDFDTVIAPVIAGLGKPVYDITDEVAQAAASPSKQAAKNVADKAAQVAAPLIDELAEKYGLTTREKAKYLEAARVETQRALEKEFAQHQIEMNHLAAEEAEADSAADTAAQAAAAAAEIQAKRDQAQKALRKSIEDAVGEAVAKAPERMAAREEQRKAQKSANSTMDDVRAHLRGFARTIPMFLMAYGDRNTTLSNFDSYTPDDVFHQVTGITEDSFRQLRDGWTDPDTGDKIPGLFDEPVFNQSIQEFYNKKEALADYFDDTIEEDIFDYIPQQKTSLVFTPRPVVQLMVDLLEQANPGIFSDPETTFCDPFSTAGLFLMELVKRLDNGLAGIIPDPEERLHHILTRQIFEMSHSKILHAITLEAVSGGNPHRKKLMADSSHYQVTNIATLNTDQRKQLAADMCGGAEA